MRHADAASGQPPLAGMAMLAVHAKSLKKARLTAGLQVVAPALLTRQCCCCCCGGDGGGGEGGGGEGAVPAAHPALLQMGLALELVSPVAWVLK